MASRSYRTFMLILLFFLSAREAHAAGVGCVTVSGNLDSGRPIIEFPESPASFSQLNAESSYQNTLDVLDWRANAHTLRMYFFHVGADTWRVAIYAEKGEIDGGSSNVPVQLAHATIQFNDSGDRVTIPSTVPDLIASPDWFGPGFVIDIAFRFVPFTQLAGPSTITGLEQGCLVPDGIAQLDFDNDGADDLVVYRPNYGLWFIRRSSDQSLLMKQWGLANDFPIAGDYDGDLKPDLVVWRPVSGNWYVCSSSRSYDCSQGTVVQFGLPGDRPVRADFDGDRILDFAIWRPSDQSYYYASSVSPGTAVVVQWGLAGDVIVGSGRND